MKIRHRLLALLVLLTAFALFVTDLVGSLLIGRAVTSRAMERLTLESDYLAGQVAAGGERIADPDGWADEAGRALGVRVTLIDAVGRVLGDSDVAADDLDGLENHLLRPEVAQAARAGVGHSARRSTTTGVEFEYLARAIGPEGPARLFIRLAVPTASLRSVSRGYRLTLTLVAALSLMVLVGASYVFIRRFSRPIETLSAAADEVASGRYEVVITRTSDDEVGALVTSIDRMRRRLIEQIGRAESERRLLASILGGLHEGILVVSREREILLVNDAFRRVFSAGRPSPEGSPMIETVWDRSILDAFDEALAGREDISRRIAATGGRSFQLTVVPFSGGPGRREGAIGLFFDVTRIEALERVRKDFIADVSHELRTPLASLKAAVETLQAGALSEPAVAERFLTILANNADRIQAILNDLTDLSLIESGAIGLSLAPIDLAAAARDAAASVAPAAAARRITVELEIPPGMTLRADRRRLDQVLVNLLDNAVKFNRVGGTVTVRARRDGPAIRVEVEDTGTGIPPDALDRVFNRFYQVDRARSRDVPGTGLGLAIVKHLVRLHGGEIRAENRPEAGTRFVMEFPPAPDPDTV